jgi:hypothetical protein
MRDITVYEAAVLDILGFDYSKLFFTESAAEEYLADEKAALEKDHDDVTGLFTDHYTFRIKPVTIYNGRQCGNTLYLLQNKSNGYLGNSPYFYAEKGGYSQWIVDAKKFTKEEAEKVVSSTVGSHKWHIWPLSRILEVAKETVDIQDLKESHDT